MPATGYTRPTASTPAASPALLMPQPSIAPLLPPAHVVDLMTTTGSAAFGARWRAKEAKIVECPALSDSMPEFATTYDIDPHANSAGSMIQPGRRLLRRTLLPGEAAAWCRSSGSARR